MFRNIPTVTKNLLIINILMCAAYYVLKTKGIDLNNILGLHFFIANDFRIYQPFTYMFMHGGFEHLFFNMFALWMFGCTIERVMGSRRFLIYYLICGLGAGFVQEIVQYATYVFEDLASYQYVQISAFERIPTEAYLNRLTTVGASGAVYAILLAFGMSFPNERIFIFPLPIPIKAKWFVCFYVALELFLAWHQAGDGIAHTAHLGGMLFGFLLIKYWQKHPDVDFTQSPNDFFRQMKWKAQQRREEPAQPRTSSREADMEYNAEKQRRQEEVDRLLDKIRKSGYESLTKEEKKRLFEASKER